MYAEALPYSRKERMFRNPNNDSKDWLSQYAPDKRIAMFHLRMTERCGDTGSPDKQLEWVWNLSEDQIEKLHFLGIPHVPQCMSHSQGADYGKISPDQIGVY